MMRSWHGDKVSGMVGQLTVEVKNIYVQAILAASWQSGGQP